MEVLARDFSITLSIRPAVSWAQTFSEAEESEVGEEKCYPTSVTPPSVQYGSLKATSLYCHWLRDSVYLVTL